MAAMVVVTATAAAMMALGGGGKIGGGIGSRPPERQSGIGLGRRGFALEV